MSSIARPTAGERSSPPSTTSTSAFSITCSLLSQYLKENKGGGLMGDFGLGIGARPAPHHETLAAAALGKSQSRTPPTTLKLLPGATADETDANGGVIDLSLLPSAERTDAREPEKSQLTIFYGGKVLVFDNFPADKAQDLMQFAGKGTATAATDRHNLVTEPKPISTSPAGGNQPAATQQPVGCGMPFARKASLHRFFEKRKDRINSKAPYPVSDSPAGKAADQESMPWIGLGSQASKLGFSLESGR